MSPVQFLVGVFGVLTLLVGVVAVVVGAWLALRAGVRLLRYAALLLRPFEAWLAGVRFSKPDPFVALVVGELGLAAERAPRRRERLEDLAFVGRLPLGSMARVTFRVDRTRPPDEALLVRIAILVPDAPAGTMRLTPWLAEPRLAGADSRGLSGVVYRLRAAPGFDDLLLAERELVLTMSAARGLSAARRALDELDRLARCFDRTPLRVRVLGGERRAFSLSGEARCAYCHAGVTGDEPDLVACPRCQTVLHGGCWSENARCPSLGCDAREPEKESVA